MSFDEGSSVYSFQTNTAVERALGGRVAALGPSVRLAALGEHGILLLKPKQGFLRQDFRRQEVHHLAPCVGGMRVSIRSQDFAEDKYAVATTNWVGTREDRLEDAV